MALKPDQVAAAIRSGVNQKIADGNNLYLVMRNGRGFWVLQYREGQNTRSKGLGSAAKVSPAQARRAREEFVVATPSRFGSESRFRAEAMAPKCSDCCLVTPLRSLLFIVRA